MIQTHKTFTQTLDFNFNWYILNDIYNSFFVKKKYIIIFEQNFEVLTIVLVL